MASVNISEAAELTGLSKSTVLRSVRKGRLSAERQEDGSFLIDPAELVRVFPVKLAISDARHDAAGDVVRRDDDAPISPDMAARLAALETELRCVRDALHDAQRDRDSWREQAVRLTAVLPSPAPSEPLPRPSIWRRIVGR